MQSSTLFQKVMKKTKIKEAIENFADDLNNGGFNEDLDLPDNVYSEVLEQQLSKDIDSSSKFSIAIHDYLVKDLDQGLSLDNFNS